MKEYNDVISQIIDISKKTTKENSILYNLELLDEKVSIKISIMESSGKEQLTKELFVERNDSLLQNFLIPLIKRFFDTNYVILDDVVDMDKDNKTTYRFITDKNDLFTINGLSFQDTNYICDVVNEIKRSKNINTDNILHINSAGKTNIRTIVVFILLIGLMCTIIYFS